MRARSRVVTISRMVDAKSGRPATPASYEAATVGDVMTQGVISCPPETPLRAVAQMMATFSVHAIFVFESGDDETESPRPWGVISDLDLVAATPLDLDAITAGATAVTPLVEISGDRPIADAGGLMAAYGIAHLAVTEPRTHRPVGVISTLDIARAVAAGHERRGFPAG
jgi:CBS domain-containing protein